MDKADNFGVVSDVKFAASDDVGVALIEFAVATALRSFAAINFADIAGFEWEVEIGLVFGDICCKWDGEVESEGEFVVAFFELVDLLLCIATCFCEEKFLAVNDGCFDGEEAITMMGV